MKTTLTTGLLLLLLLAAASSGGCTGSQDKNPVAEKGSGPAIRVITENYPPFNTVGSDGVIGGQSTEIVQEIARRQGANITLEMLPWSDGYRIVQDGPDVALYSTSRTAERENLFRWVGPIGSIDYWFYARNGSLISIPSLEAAKKIGTIGVVKDDMRHQLLQSENVTNLALCSDDTECAGKLFGGSIDLWLGSNNAPDAARQAGIDPAVFRPVYRLQSTDLYIAFSNTTPDETIAAWQAALDAMKRDGTWNRIMGKYSGSGSAPPANGTGSVPASAIVSLTEGRLNAVLRPLQVLALTEDVRSGDWNRIRPLLAGLEAKEPSARLWYSRPNGSYYTTVDNLTTANLFDRPYFPDLLAGRDSVGTLVTSHSTGRSVVIIAVPVIDRGSVTGMLGASVSLDDLGREVQDSLGFSDNRQFFAVDSGGTIALHSDIARISQNEIGSGSVLPGSFGAAVKGMLLSGNGSLSYNDGGRHWTGEFRTSPLTGWHFAVASADSA